MKSQVLSYILSGLSILLIGWMPANALANEQNASAMISGAAVSNDLKGGKELVIERSFTISYIKVPKRCETDAFKSTCTRLVNYYARRFEREMVSNISVEYSQENPFEQDIFDVDKQKEKAVQHVQINLYSKPGEPLVSLFSIFKQKNVNSPEQLLVETMNFDENTGRIIRFNELFENPQLAAMLCARAIEEKYSSFKSPLLPVVVSATELNPSNFIITARGLRFFFAPGLVKPNNNIAQSIFITLDMLKSAKPKDEWWSGKLQPITEAEKKALANSTLKDVIDLDSDFAVSDSINSLDNKQIANQSAASIGDNSIEDPAVKGKSETIVKNNQQKKPQLKN